MHLVFPDGRRLGCVLLVALWLFPCMSHADALRGSGAGTEWDDRDVEAAEAYRRSERARAERYRAEVARREAGRRAPRVAAARSAAATRTAARSGPDWWDRALADLDEGLARVADGTRTVIEWRAFWTAEVEPRWRSWRDWRERESDSLAARLVDVMLGDARGAAHED